MASKKRSAALVISAFVEPQGNPDWYARIAYYEDAQGLAFRTKPQTTVDGVCEAVRRWLESIVDEGPDENGSIVKGRKEARHR